MFSGHFHMRFRQIGAVLLDRLCSKKYLKKRIFSGFFETNDAKTFLADRLTGYGFHPSKEN